MAYALESLLRIRGQREDRAGAELSAARRAQSAAERHRDETRAKHQDFVAAAPARRDAVYDALMGRAVTCGELERAREAVAAIDEEALLLGEAAARAAEACETAVAATGRAQRQLLRATREKTKIERHRQIWAEEDRREREHRAESETEEFAGRMLSADDDDSLD